MIMMKFLWILLLTPTIFCQQQVTNSTGVRLFRQRLILEKVQLMDQNQKVLFENVPKFYSELWEDYKRIHGKKYHTTEEEQNRFVIFINNYEMVNKHNEAYDAGLKSYKMKINKFSDMDNKEFVATMNGYKSRPSLRNSSTKGYRSRFLPPMNVVLPTTLDWRQEGYVTAVKNQGQCGSCWAFSTTGSLEGQHYRKTKQLVSLSEQNLVDCSTKNDGCDGGNMDTAFEYIKENGGIDTEESYPYTGEDDTCHFNKETIGATCVGYQDLMADNETELMIAVGTVGPISVGIDASNPSFQSYSKGVYYEPACNSTKLDHGVLLVGYGISDQNEKYWLVKNSWGTDWGDEGYIKMARFRDNNCGIASEASYPLV